MEDCFSIKKVSELSKLIKKEGKNPLADYLIQYPTNLSFLYKLEDGRYVLLPNNLDDKLDGLIFKNEKCLSHYINKDFFPIENPNKRIYEYEQEIILNVDKEFSSSQEYLNQQLGLSYDDVSVSILQSYSEKLVDLAESDQIRPKDYIALGIILGEFLRKEEDHKWILIKQYGMFNPFYIPDLVTEEGKIINFFEKVVSMIDSKNPNINYLINRKTIVDPKLSTEMLIIAKKEYLIL